MNVPLNEPYKALLALANSCNISKNELSNMLSEAIVDSYKKIMEYQNVHVEINHNLHRIIVYRKWRVVEKVTNSENEISNFDIKCSNIDKKDIKDGFYLEKLSLTNAGRNIAYTVSYRIKVSILKHQAEQLKKKIVNTTELLSGKVVSENSKGFDIYIPKYLIYGFLPKNSRLKFDKFIPGDTVKAIATDVLVKDKDIRLSLSRTHADFIKSIMELVMPECKSGQIKIVRIARKPSYRCKIAVCSNTPYIDSDKVLYACIGHKGQRIEALKSYIGTEKVDICTWSDNFEDVIRGSLAGVEISSIKYEEDSNTVFLHLQNEEDIPKTLGSKGLNIFLTGQLIKKKIIIINSNYDAHTQ